MNADLLDCSNSLLPWLPDETLFSLCSRQHRLWGYSTSEKSAEVMFGGRHAGTHHDLPSGLDEFALRTGGTLGAGDDIARDRTLLRYYRPFLAASEVDHAAAIMRGRSVANLKFRLGLLTSRFRANHPLKACATCMRRDVDEHGWAYWHMQHQFPGVWLCPSHGEPLLASTLKSTGVGRFLWHLPATCELNVARPSATQGSEEALHGLARLTTELIERAADDGWLEPLAVQPTLRARLYEKGWMTASGNVRLSGAAADFVAHCRGLRGAFELSGLPANLEEAKMQVGRLARPLRSGTHPLRLLVAIDWLFEDASDFIAQHSIQGAAAIDQSPGPTPKSDAVAPEGVGSCKVGWIELLRAGLNTTAAAHLIGVDVGTAMAWAAAAGIAVRRRPKVVTPEVRKSLVRALCDGADKIDAAGRHGISIETVTKVLRTEVGLHAAWKAARAVKARQSARDAWANLLSEHSALGTKLMRAMNPAAYAWLYRNDRDWLLAHTPDERVNAGEARASSVRWDERDQALSLAVKRAVLFLVRDGAGNPLRLWQIYQAVPELKPKLAALDQLPLTKRALEAALGRHDARPAPEDLFG